MKQFLRSTLNKCGFDIVRSKISNDNLSKHLYNVHVSKNIECIIDVGANSGQYGQFLRKIGYKGFIISFEPVSAVFKELKAKCGQGDKWICYDYALADKNHLQQEGFF